MCETEKSNLLNFLWSDCLSRYGLVGVVCFSWFTLVNTISLNKDRKLCQNNLSETEEIVTYKK